MIRKTFIPAIWPASFVAVRWESLKYAGTVMTAFLIFWPRNRNKNKQRSKWRRRREGRKAKIIGKQKKEEITKRKKKELTQIGFSYLFHFGQYHSTDFFRRESFQLTLISNFKKRLISFTWNYFERPMGQIWFNNWIWITSSNQSAKS